MLSSFRGVGGGMKNLFRTVVALGVVPLLWPAVFMGLALVTETDPLLSGSQNVLYPAGLIWLVVVLFISLVIGRFMKRKLTNSLFLISAVGATALTGAIFVFANAWGTFQSIEKKEIIYPDHFDWNYVIDQFWHVTLFAVAVSLITALFFIGVGGLRFAQSSPK